MIVYLIIILLFITARILFLLNAEKYFGSNKEEKKRVIKSDRFILIAISLAIIKIAEYIFGLFSSNHKWWDFITTTLMLVLFYFFTYKLKLDSRRKQIIESWKTANLFTKIFLIALLLFVLGYWMVLVKQLFTG